MLNGALILNKPSGISSGVFSRKVKKLLNQKEKVGHAGTLDPLADGVLIVCIGEMTKFISYLTDETKTYVAEITIGIKTTTGDIEGDVVDSSKYLKLNINNYISSFIKLPLYLRELYKVTLFELERRINILHDNKRNYINVEFSIEERN